MGAAVDMQEHPRQGTSRTRLAVRSPFRRPSHQTGRLQRRLHPCVAELDPVLLVQLLDEMLHVEVEIPLPIQTQHSLDLIDRHSLRAGLLRPPVEQAVTTEWLGPLSPNRIET